MKKAIHNEETTHFGWHSIFTVSETPIFRNCLNKN